MKRVFQFKSPSGAYHCDASVIACFDNRFDRVVRKFLKRIKVTNPDPILVAGGSKPLSSPENLADRAFILDQIAKSIRLHGTERVILLLHSDCGAYGGLHKFQGDAEAELVHHRAELRLAYGHLKTAFPTVAVECYFVDFTGVWQLDVSTLPAP